MATVNVKLFAGLQGLVGRPSVDVLVPDGATVGQLRAQIVEDYPVLEAFMGTLVCAVGEEMVDAEHVLKTNEQVELIPPISGGGT